MEHIQSVDLLAGRNELDRFSYYCLDGKGGTATGITIHLRQDHAIEIKSLIERLGSLDGILTGHGIHHEENFGRIHRPLDGSDLIHHLLIHGQTAGSINDYDRKTLSLGLCYSILRNLYRILDTILSINRDTGLLAHDLQLVDGCRTIDVARGQKHLHALLRLAEVRKFRGKSRLTGTLETGNQDNAGITLNINVLGTAAHELGELIMDNLDHHLLRFHGRQHILAHRLVLHAVAEFLRHLVAHVGIKQRLANVLYSLGDIDFRNFSLSLENLERPFQSF